MREKISRVIIEGRTVLNLDNNNIGDEGTRELAAALRDPKCRLTSLILTNNNIGAAGVRELGAAIRDSHCRLVFLDIRYTNIEGGLAEEMRASLQHNHSIIQFYGIEANDIINRNQQLLVNRCKKILQGRGWSPKTEALVLDQCRQTLKYKEIELNGINPEQLQQVIKTLENKFYRSVCGKQLTEMPATLQEIITGSVEGVSSHLYKSYFQYEAIKNILTKTTIVTVPLLCSSLPMLYYSTIATTAFIIVASTFTTIFAAYRLQYIVPIAHRFYEKIEEILYDNELKRYLVALPLISVLPVDYCTPSNYKLNTLSVLTTVAACFTAFELDKSPNMPKSIASAYQAIYSKVEKTIESFSFVDKYKHDIPSVECISI